MRARDRRARSAGAAGWTPKAAPAEGQPGGRAPGGGPKGVRQGRWKRGVAPLLALGVAAFAAGGGWGLAAAERRGAVVDWAGRSFDVYPEQRIPLLFKHQRHLELGVHCVLCHGSVQTSESALDRNIPGHSTCGICHLMQLPNASEIYPKAACTTCHGAVVEGRPEDLGPPPEFAPLDAGKHPISLEIPPARLNFSHKLHIDRGTPCLDCHPGVDQATLATRDHLPDMRLCLGCHDGTTAPSDCTVCHLQGAGGRVRTDLGGAALLAPTGRFRPDDHGDPRWLEMLHRSAARFDAESCNACHAPQACLDCHDGTVEPRGLHPADWVMTHGLQALHGAPDCRACHDAQSFCQDCHAAAAVLPGAFPGVQADPPGGLRFHPEGWGGTVGEIPGPEHHSHPARRSLEACQGCHVDDDCRSCHAIVSPHPESWKEPPAGWRFGQGEGTVCLRCHAPQDERLDAVGR
jgi:hypothetical protein